MILNTCPFLYEKPLGSRSHLTFVTCFILTLFFAFCQKISQDLVSSMEISFFEGLRESFSYSVKPVSYELGSSYLHGFFTLPFGKAFSHKFNSK